MNDVWKQLYQVVQDRKASPQEGSYTCYLFDKGLDKILKKVGEECAETIIAASRTSLWKLCWRSWTAAVTRSGI